MARHTVPSCPDSERAVLGSMILDRKTIPRLATILSPEDFGFEPNAHVFRAAMALHERGLGVDHVALTEELRHAGVLEMLPEGQVYLAVVLMEAGVSLSEYETHGRLVYESAQRRRAVQAAKNLAQAAQSSDPMESVEWAAQRAVLVSAPRSRNVPHFDLGVDMAANPDRYLPPSSEVGKLIGLATGLSALDEMTLGWKRGELILVAGRPSVGKTAFGLFTALHAAQGGCHVYFGSIEMTRADIVTRLTSSVARIDSHVLSRGGLSAEMESRAIGAQGEVCNLGLTMTDESSPYVEEIRDSVVAAHGERPLGLVVIDYLQLMRSRGKYENRTTEVGRVSAGLKALAKDLLVPVIALSQLSRPPKGSEGRNPYLSDLRDSGSLEQDADTVCLLHDVGRLSRNAGEFERIELTVAKNRNGPVGSTDLRYRREIGTFEPWR